MGPAGPAGPQGAAGAAATVRVGSVATGEPGTPAQVTNSGTDTDAVLNFVIPRGAPGGGVPEVLTAVDTGPRDTTVDGPLVFADTALVSGTAVTHQAGAAEVRINQPGIYQATFQGGLSPDADTPVPSSMTVRLLLNGTPVAGAAARHTFTAAGEAATMFFSAPFRVDGAAALQVVSGVSGFNVQDAALTVSRLGDAT